MDAISVLRLRPGDRVLVRSEPEILDTLDASGALDGLPFMPEMRKFCGHSFRVAARADRTSHDKLGMRRMRDTVHLEELRCDGAAHDGCDRGCLIFWKERWQARIPVSPAPTTPERVLATTDESGYFCQATQLHRASVRLGTFDLRLDLRAPVTEGLSPRVLFRSLGIWGYDFLQRRIGGKEWNQLSGSCKKTPSVSLGLRPGERVRVKSEPEILATLNARGLNHGMDFPREMLRYCGREAVVLRRAERVLVDHKTRMILMKDTVILEGAVYQALNRRAVPRRQYMFWRECWLERI
jgi:hypothetical protein